MSKESGYADRLPGGYCKEAGSVNERLLALPGGALEEAKKDLEMVEDAAELEKARGKTLDLFGKSLGMPRGALDDTQYRFLLKSRVARNFTAGSHESVMRSAMNMFGVGEGEIQLSDDEACSGVVRVRKLPFGVLQSLGLTGRQATRILKELIPAGVRLESDPFEGSFAFGDAWDEREEKAGFADHEDPEMQTMGGFLGFVAGDDEAPPLPF